MSLAIASTHLLAMTGAEVHTLNDALHAGSRPEDLEFSPSLIPDYDASNESIAQAVEQLRDGMQ